MVDATFAITSDIVVNTVFIMEKTNGKSHNTYPMLLYRGKK